MAMSEEEKLFVLRLVFGWLHNGYVKERDRPTSATSSAAAWLDAGRPIAIATWLNVNFICSLCIDPGDDDPCYYHNLCPRHREITRIDTDNLIWCTNRHSLLFLGKFLCAICNKPFCENCTMVKQGKTVCESHCE